MWCNGFLIFRRCQKNDAVHVVRHDHEGIQPDLVTHLGCSMPLLDDDPTICVQVHTSSDDFAK